MLLALLALLAAATAHAQPAAPGPATAVRDAGPPVPTLPDTISRDDQGRATVIAVRVPTPMRIDGVLDEALYTRCGRPPTSSRWSRAPAQPATEKTEVWVSFDDNNLYVSFKAWESQPERLVANEMRRDSGNIRQGDSVGFGFDTFHDRRNAIQFETNALGARSDGQITNERQFNPDWNPVWRVAVGRVRGRLDDRSDHPVQVAALRAGHDADLGLPGAPHQQVEERDLVPHEDPERLRARPGRLLGLALRRRWSASRCRTWRARSS